MSCPTPDMMAAAKRVLYYLSHHRSVGLRYARADGLPFTGFSDSDWAMRHSTSGHARIASLPSGDATGNTALVWRPPSCRE
eukprot:1039295-Pleurochrysis_carterae.AAC.1